MPSKQKELIILNDHRIIIKDLPIQFSSALDEKGKKAFIQDYENQAITKSGAWIQCVTEDSAYPIPMIDNSEERRLRMELRSLLADDESLSAARIEQANKAKSNPLFDRIVAITAITCGTFALIAFMVLKF